MGAAPKSRIRESGHLYRVPNAVDEKSFPNSSPGGHDVESTACDHLEQCRKRVADGKHWFEGVGRNQPITRCS